VAALIAAGYSSDYEGEAYRTVSGQNSNNSVLSPKLFPCFKRRIALELTSRITGKVTKTVPSQKLWDDIAFAAWPVPIPAYSLIPPLMSGYLPEGVASMPQIPAQSICSWIIRPATWLLLTWLIF